MNKTVMSNTFKYVILSRVMNMAFDGIVLSRVTELLNETIVTGRISKLYQISKYELLMTVRAQNENKKLLVSIHPGSLTVDFNLSLTKSLKTLIISMLLSFFIVKFVKL